jgi:hypothetical protein
MLFATISNENCRTEGEVQNNLQNLIFGQAFVGCRCHHRPNVHIQFQFHKSQFQTLEFCAGSYERKMSGWIKHRDKQTCNRSIPVPEVSIQIPEVCAGNHERKTSGWIKYRDKQKGAINCFSKENIKICTCNQLIAHKNDYKIAFKTQNQT